MRGCISRPTGWGTQPLRIAIPLGLNAHQFARCVIHRRGEVSSPSGLGDPTPTGSGVCDNTTLRSSGARGLDWTVSRCYRHIAPLERKAPTHQNSRCVMHRIGLVSSPSGLGDPTPTGFNPPLSPRRCVKYSFRITYHVLPYVITCAPLGLWCVGVCRVL